MKQPCSVLYFISANKNQFVETVKSYKALGLKLPESKLKK